MNETTDSEIRRGRKFEQVLQGALRVFMREGFEGASMDVIAREAGVSKATLYVYFPDKRLLFTEICRIECQRHANETTARIDMNAPIRDALSVIASQVTEFLASDFGRDMYRLVVSEIARFPELGRDFYLNGPGLLKGRMANQLRQLAGRGELGIEDFPLAAEQLVQLCKVQMHDHLLLGLTKSLTPNKKKEVAKAAVEMFLARYANKATPPARQSEA